MNGQVIVRFLKKELNYSIDPKHPFVGSEFNMTKAGIHADGLLKDESIYNSFDTGKVLNCPPAVKINQSSSAAGIAAWINVYYYLDGVEKAEKRYPRIAMIQKMDRRHLRSGKK